MPPSRPGDLSASMAVLGLVVQQSDTVAGVGVRLVKTFPRAHWARNAVHNNLSSLVTQGFVRLVEKGSADSGALDRYEATRRGVERFRGWVRESAAVPPALRDAVQGKLRFAERGDLLSLIQTVREQEDACRHEYTNAHASDMEERALRRRRGGQDDWVKVRLRGISVSDEARLWGMNAQRLQKLREELEGLVEEIEIELPDVGSGDGDG